MLHFEISEFDSPDEPGSGNRMQETTLRMLDDARSIAGIPFRINSGFRSKSHNAYIGGSKHSSHCYGYAVDIHCTDSRSRSVIIDSLRTAGKQVSHSLYDAPSPNEREIGRPVP